QRRRRRNPVGDVHANALGHETISGQADRHPTAPSSHEMPRGTEDPSLEEIRQRCIDKPVSPHILKRLQRDPRQGARHLYQSLKKRYDRERGEKLRLQAMRHFELVLWRTGVRDIAGVDEAGVGPLAGPVVAAAVMFPSDTDIAGVDDSKQLDPDTRERL